VTVLRTVGGRVRIWQFSVLRNRGRNAVYIGRVDDSHDFGVPYGKIPAENRHLLKETGILDSLFRFCGTRWGSAVVLTVIVSGTHHFADSKPDQMRSVKITRPEAQFFDSASSQRVSVSTSHARSIARPIHPQYVRRGCALHCTTRLLTAIMGVLYECPCAI